MFSNKRYKSWMRYVGKVMYSDKELKQIFKNSTLKSKWHFSN